MPVQHVWLGAPSSALGASTSFSSSAGSVLLRLTDDLLNPSGTPLAVGDMVQAVGYARLLPAVTDGPAAACMGGWSGLGGQMARAAGTVELAAVHVGRADPTLVWRPQGFVPWRAGPAPGRGGQQDPVQLQELCNALMDGLGRDVSYPLCLALLVSAACVHRAPDPSCAPPAAAGDSAAATGGELAAVRGGGGSSMGGTQPASRASKRSYDAKALQQLSLLLVTESAGSQVRAVGLPVGVGAGFPAYHFLP